MTRLCVRMGMVALGMALALTAWAGGETEEGSAGTAAAAAASSGAYGEAPVLAQMVAAGDLPPVEERLPDNPMVVTTGTLVRAEDLTVEIGQYGGTLRSVTANPELDWNLRDAAMENFIMSPAHTVNPMMGNVAGSFEISDDNRVFTFTLRSGLKWSDGTPVSTEDMKFAVEDVLFLEALTPALPSRWKAGGQPDGTPMTFEVVDGLTFRISFDQRYGRFVREMGVGQLWGGYNEILKPRHVLLQYHQRHADAADLEASLKESGLGADEWHRLFLQKDILWHENMRSDAANFPTLGPWVRVESPQDLMVMERNPYYYKVDAAGNQLPYVDRYESVIVAKAENIPLKVIAGDVNLNRDLIAHDKVPLLKENEERGGYRVDTNLVYHNAPVAMFLNYLNPDENWREVVWNERFRAAVNKAINYQNIIDVMFLGLGEPNPWIEPDYNPEEAMRILDEIGLDKKDADGFRLGPDGEQFQFVFEIREGAADWEKMGELITADLEAVGIRTPLKLIARQLWIERRDAGQLYATLDWLDDVNWPILVTDYLPNTRSRWGQGWHTWLGTGGAQGEEPPAWIKELYALYGTFTAELPNSDQALSAVDQFAAWMTTYIPMFPLARDVVGPVIVPPNLGNLAGSGKSSATWFAAEQFYLK